MAEHCLPYDLKCWESTGVVSPVDNKDECSAYEHDPLWYRPCRCIPTDVRPTQIRCPEAAAPKDCAFNIFPFAFHVAGVGDGLTIPQTVLNMKKHVSEYGPIYVAYFVTSSFMAWNWARRPIYRGG